MLVLTRNIGQGIVVTIPGHGEVLLHVMEIRSGRVRIGIDAARDILVRRAEIAPVDTIVDSMRNNAEVVG